MTALSLAQPGKNYTIKWNVFQSNIAADVENLGLYPGETLFLISSYFGNVIVRACSHKRCMRIFKRNFVLCKAKLCRHTRVFQIILTKQRAKFVKRHVQRLM